LRTIPWAFFRDGGWNPWAKRGSRRDGRRECLMWWRDFQTEYRMWSGPGAGVFEHRARALDTSSGVRGD